MFTLQYCSYWTQSPLFDWCYPSQTETILKVMLWEESVCCIRDRSQTALSRSPLSLTSWFR